MNSRNALIRGLAATNRSKRLLLMLLAANVLVALIPTLIVREELARSMGRGAAAIEMADGYSELWFREFEAQADRLAGTFHPTVSGVGAILNGFDSMFTGNLPRPGKVILGLGLLYALFWVFSAGGVLSLFVTGKRFRFREFGSDCARYFGRFLRISLLAVWAYYLLFTGLFPLLQEAVGWATRETVDERVAFAWTLGKFVVVVAALSAVSLLSDYTKICVVAERRHSVLLALLRAVRLVGRHWGSAVLLYASIAGLSMLLLLIYGLAAPGATQQSWAGILWALFLGQLYILSRIWIRILFYAAQTELFLDFEEVSNWQALARPQGEDPRRGGVSAEGQPGAQLV